MRLTQSMLTMRHLEEAICIVIDFTTVFVLVFKKMQDTVI
jgi:hypothetical protein